MRVPLPLDQCQGHNTYVCMFINQHTCVHPESLQERLTRTQMQQNVNIWGLGTTGIWGFLVLCL